MIISSKQKNRTWLISLGLASIFGLAISADCKAEQLDEEKFFSEVKKNRDGVRKEVGFSFYNIKVGELIGIYMEEGSSRAKGIYHEDYYTDKNEKEKSEIVEIDCYYMTNAQWYCSNTNKFSEDFRFVIGN